MIVGLIVSVLQSCSLFDEAKTPERENNIRFIVSEWSQTKGSIIYSSSIQDFGLFGYLYSTPWSTHYKPDFIYNDQVTKTSGWSTPYIYPNDGRYVKFYAYSPHNCPGLELPSKEDGGRLIFTYTVPEEIADQKDLMLSQSDEILGKGAKGSVTLQFHHTLCAIKFETDTDIKGGTIKSIAIKGVYSKGRLQYGDTPSATPSWTIEGTKADFSITGMEKTVEDGVAGQKITSEDQTFMMIPQTLPSGATLEIVFDDGSEERLLTRPMSGLKWPQGEIITYKISTTSF